MADSKLHCPDCDTDVHVGTGGISNLNMHQDLKTCWESKATKAQPPQKEKSTLSFFSQSSVQQNTPQVVLPPPVHATPLQHESTCHPESITPPIFNGDKVIVDNQLCPCPSALKLMWELKVGVEAMPKDVEPTLLDHPLAAFSGDLTKCVLENVEDNWDRNTVAFVCNPHQCVQFTWRKVMAGHNGIMLIWSIQNVWTWFSSSMWLQQHPQKTHNAQMFPLCVQYAPPKLPAVWTYSLDTHFCDSHSLSHDQFPIKHHLSWSETEGIQIVWKIGDNTSSSLRGAMH